VAIATSVAAVALLIRLSPGKGPEWPPWISALTDVATFLVVLVSAGFALSGFYDSRRTRYGQLITELQRQWTEPALVESIKLNAQYDAAKLQTFIAMMFGPDASPTDEEREDWSKLARLANLIESMGVLSSERALTHDVIYRMWGGQIMETWKRWEPAVVDLRDYDGEPDTFEYFQEVALAMRRIAAARKTAREAAAAASATSSAAVAGPGTNAV